ncbi:MAG: hypothetical protein E6Q67_04575 [Roseateles sp.]|nr:MAG: hypothetical protein E6Q67_04575 [Roseateles sp.]
MSEPEATQKLTPSADVMVRQMVDVLSGPLPKLYFNTFTVAATNKDVTVVLKLSDVPVGAVLASYETVADLYEHLGKALESRAQATPNV